MKILVGYVLALTVMIGGFVTGWTWLTTEPVREAVRKPVVAKVQPAPAVERDETVTFPEPPPRPAIAAVQDTPAASPAPVVAPVAATAAPSPEASELSAFARAEPAKPAARVAKKKKTRPRYEVMVERTIQYPDGRVVRRLIPLSQARGMDAYAQYRW